MAYSHVAHDCHVGSKIVMANCATLGGHVELGDWVIMGGYPGVHQFCKVGAHAFLGNNARGRPATCRPTSWSVGTAGRCRTPSIPKG